jgi:hypothetical protein
VKEISAFLQRNNLPEDVGKIIDSVFVYVFADRSEWSGKITSIQVSDTFIGMITNIVSYDSPGTIFALEEVDVPSPRQDMSSSSNVHMLTGHWKKQLQLVPLEGSFYYEGAFTFVG